MDDDHCVCLDCETRLAELKPCTNCGSHRVDLWTPSFDMFDEDFRVSYHDREGKPLTLLEYAERYGSYEAREDYRKIDYTEVGGMAFVSTIWLGVNHRIGAGPPLIFETMAFLIPREDDPPGRWGGSLTSLEEFVDTRRYSTEAEARAGHLEVVAEVEAWLAAQRAWIEVAVADIEGEQE